MDSVKKQKMEELRKKLLSLSQEEYEKLLDTSTDKPEYKYERSLRMLGDSNPSKKADVMETRNSNPDWKASRGQRHELNSTKVEVYKGTKVGNGRWGTLDVVDLKYFGTYPSLGEAAKATGMTKAAVSACLSGKIRFSKGFTFKAIENE